MMTSPFLVSVIIPAYNAEQFIEQTILSVVNQTWPSIEIIVIDDGSTDNTQGVVNSIETSRPIKYLKQLNMGCSAAKNVGLLHARGTYIQFLDADDCLSPNKIAEQVNAIKDDPLRIAICTTKIFEFDLNATLPEVDTEMLFSTDNPGEFLLNLYGLNGKIGMIQPNAFLVSKRLCEIVGPYDLSISPSPDEDGEFFCRVMLNSSSIVYTPNCLNYYRRLKRSSSLSFQHSRAHARGALISLERKEKHLLKYEDSDRVRRIIAEHYAGFMYQYFDSYPDLCSQAESNIHSLGIEGIPVVGGWRFKLLSRIIGVKSALQTRHLLTRLLPDRK